MDELTRFTDRSKIVNDGDYNEGYYRAEAEALAERDATAEAWGDRCEDCGNGSGLNAAVFLCPIHRAAPKLLAALQGMVAAWDAGNSPYPDRIDAARAAIAATKGA